MLDGHGHRLMYESSTIGKVTKFLSSLPDLMVSIVLRELADTGFVSAQNFVKLGLYLKKCYDKQQAS